MTKIAKSKFKQHRRLKANISGNPKSSFETRNYPPGEHGKTAIPNIKDYKKQLEAKQRLKWYYGGSRLREKQFRNLFKKAGNMKGDTGENFVGLLETRLDVAVYHLSLAPTIFAARQLVSHKHVTVNGRVVNVSSYRVKVNDVIGVTDSAKSFVSVVGSVQNNKSNVPTYWEFDEKAMCGKLLKVPSFSEIPYPFDANVNLIIEYYSR